MTRPLDCTTSKAAPILDTVFAGLEGVRTGVALAAKDSDYSKLPISRGADIGFGVGFTALFVASAIYGFHSTATCSYEMERRESLLEERSSMARAAPAPATPPKPAFSTATPPVEVAGFAFGSSMDAARAACESASFEWRPSGSAYQCSGTPVDTGLGARARITFCSDEICRIELLVAPKEDEGAVWADRFTKMLDDLRTRYEEPTSHDVVYADSSCTGARLLECLRSGSAHFRYEWRWDDRKRVVLSLGSRSQATNSGSGANTLAPATIHVRYEDGRQPERVPKVPAKVEVEQPTMRDTASEGAQPRTQPVTPENGQPSTAEVGRPTAPAATSQSGRVARPEAP